MSVEMETSVETRRLIRQAITYNDANSLKNLLQDRNPNLIIHVLEDTPLHLSAALGHLECVRVLLKANAKIDEKNKNGQTPIHLSVKYRQHECVKLLLQQGAKIDTKDTMEVLQFDERGGKLLAYLGITPQQLRETKTTDMVSEYIKQHGGLEKTLAQYETPEQAAPSQKEVPEEILLRGPVALKAYQQALKFGSALDTRKMIMFIGQEGAGKTSLKKSLLRQKFDPDERTTEGISCDEHVTVETCQSWEPGRKLEFADHAAKYVLEKMEEDEVGENLEEERTIEEDVGQPNIDNQQTSNEPSHLETETETETENAPSDEIDLSTHEVPQSVQMDESVPYDVITKMIHLKLHRESSNDDDEALCPALWDFAGQTLFYATHAIFMSRHGIYILVHDSTKDLYSKAEPRKIPGSSTQDAHSSVNNLDFINFWLSSVHSLTKRPAGGAEASCGDNEQSVPVPPVILVLTKADISQENEDRETRKTNLLREILRNVEDTSFGKHLLSRTDNVFYIDNTKSGEKDEDSDVQKLREFIPELAKKLPHTGKIIPLRWLHAEEYTTSLPDNGVFYIETEKLKEQWIMECNIMERKTEEGGIVDEGKILLDFLHDRGVVLHFEETEALNKLVILKPQWLIDLFKKIITISGFPGQECEPQSIKRCRKSLEKEGILSCELIDFVCEKVCGRNETLTKEAVVSLMERFSLVCKWVNDDGSHFYIVPCMLVASVPEATNSPDLHPIFICFEDGYVPIGLFPRLVAQAIHWSIMKWSVDPPVLRKNFARFHIGENGDYAMIITCSMYHIKVSLFSDKEEEEGSTAEFSGICSEVIEFLGQSVAQMEKDFHWLNGMTYWFAIKCTRCPDEREADESCARHRSKDCTSDDCAHFVRVNLPERKTTPRCKKVLHGSSWLSVDKRWCQGSKRSAAVSNTEVLPVKMNQAVCRDVSDLIPAQLWKTLLTNLGLSQTKISHIDCDNVESREKVYQGLLTCYEADCVKTFEQLVQVLEELDHTVADKLKDGSAFYQPHIPDPNYTDPVVSDDICLVLSNKVADQWKWLLRYLFIPERVIRCIAIDASPNTVQEKCFQGLSSWIKTYGNSCKHFDLMNALTAIGRPGLLE